MKQEKIQWLCEEIANLELAATHLEFSLDRIQRAEKRGWMDEAGQLVRIRELRNLIAHEYASDKMPDIYRAVAVLTPCLLTAIPKVKAHGEALIRRYTGDEKNQIR